MSQGLRRPMFAEINTLLSRFSTQTYMSLVPSITLLGSVRLVHAAKPTSLPTESQSQLHVELQSENSLLSQGFSRA